MNELGHAQARALIARHFEGVIRPDEERALREHLPDCAACRGSYQRRLVLSRLDPKSPTPEARLARGLGLRPARRPLLPSLVLVPSLATAALCGLFLLLRSPGADPAGFRPRGTALPPQASTRVYQLLPGWPPVEVAGEIGANAELAFSYEDGSDDRYLMIFGVDEAQRIYWYYPAWTDPAQNPNSLALPPGAERRELPEAVRQRLLGRELTLCHFFSDKPWTVRDVEARLAGSGKPQDLPGLVACRKLSVAP